MSGAYVYVDVGAVRIQQYLARTASLRGHRAASNNLAQATADASIEPVVRDLAEINPEAGKADGVVSLRFFAAAGQKREQRVRRLQDRVLAHLRRALPGAEFHSVWGEGESYLAVYAHVMQPRVQRGQVRHDLPPTAEFPLAVPCRMCHTDPASGIEPVPDGRRALCLDCSARNVPRRQVVADAGSPEGRLLQDIGLAPAPDSFADLAALGSAASGRNHLATVAVDGNAFGVFFAALAEEGSQDAQMREEKATISQTLSAATRTALTHAVLELPLTMEREQLCLVPHVIGGDDVLVSLPADQAWWFALRFLEEFERLVRKETAGVLERLNRLRAARGGLAALEAPTASAGVVFAHASHPMNLLVESAGTRLSEAKRAFRGQRAAVQWLDITADGPDHPGHPPVALSLLRNGDGSHSPAAAALGRLVKVPARHRVRLTEALRGSGPLAAAALADRVGHLNAIRPFLPPLDELAQLPAPGDGRLPASGIGLEAALNLARWWPCA